MGIIYSRSLKIHPSLQQKKNSKNDSLASSSSLSSFFLRKKLLANEQEDYMKKREHEITFRSVKKALYLFEKRKYEKTINFCKEQRKRLFLKGTPLPTSSLSSLYINIEKKKEKEKEKEKFLEQDQNWPSPKITSYLYLMIMALSLLFYFSSEFFGSAFYKSFLKTKKRKARVSTTSLSFLEIPESEKRVLLTILEKTLESLDAVILFWDSFLRESKKEKNKISNKNNNKKSETLEYLLLLAFGARGLTKELENLTRKSGFISPLSVVGSPMLSVKPLMRIPAQQGPFFRESDREKQSVFWYPSLDHHDNKNKNKNIEKENDKRLLSGSRTDFAMARRCKPLYAFFQEISTTFFTISNIKDIMERFEKDVLEKSSLMHFLFIYSLDPDKEKEEKEEIEEKDDDEKEDSLDCSVVSFLSEEEYEKKSIAEMMYG